MKTNDNNKIKYCDLSVTHRSSICLSLWQIIELLYIDESQYFAQPRPIIVINYDITRLNQMSILMFLSKVRFPTRTPDLWFIFMAVTG